MSIENPTQGFTTRSYEETFNNISQIPQKCFRVEEIISGGED